MSDKIKDQKVIFNIKFYFVLIYFNQNNKETRR